MGLSRLAAWTAFGLVVTAAVFVGSDAQGQVPGPGSQAPTIKSEVRIVLVDVVVTSGDGRPVRGLRKEDFQVTEDGRPKRFRFLRNIRVEPFQPLRCLRRRQTFTRTIPR
jgi:hypothetical protein